MTASKDVQKIVFDEITAILKRKNAAAKPVNPDDRLFGGESGMDSLDMAELIVRLEGIFGADPFSRGEQVQTIKGLIEFYKREGR